MDGPADRIDVLISCCTRDLEWAGYLDRRLRDEGLSTYLSTFDLLPGSDITLETDDALRRTDVAMVFVSEASAAAMAAGDTAAAAEYSILARLADAKRLRLIPVLLAVAPMPSRLVRYTPLSLIGVRDADDVERCMPRLLAAVRGEEPPRDDAAVPQFDRVPEGSVPAVLRIDDTALTLRTPAGERKAPLVESLSDRYALPTAAAAPWREIQREVRRDLRAEAGHHHDSIEVVGPIAAALSELVAACERQGSPLRLGLDIVADSPLNDLPWEGMRVAGLADPLALQRSVVLHRSVTGLGQIVAPLVPGPLRILAVIASPDHGGGPLLDYEHELATILQQVDAARRDRAYVRILNWGSVESIRDALRDERFHVLHISCHAEPGRLVLEKPGGEADFVDAATFVRHVLVPEKPVPLVVLAGCSTALSGPGRRGAGDDALPGFARTLLERGVPAVLAMTAPVTDKYATDLLARVYRYLAQDRDDPDPVAALAAARRDIEQARRKLAATDPRAGPVEWATPALFTRVSSLTLFDPAQPAAPVREAGAPRIDFEIVNLEIGDFVGRRRELRQMLAVMRDRRTRGVLIHGIGGVGKSSLAAAVLNELAEDRLRVVTVHGPRTADQILARITRRLIDDGVAPKELTEVDDANEDLNTRLGGLRHVLRTGPPLVLLLDDPLGDPLLELRPGQELDGQPEVPYAGEELLTFLDRFLDLGTNARVILTLRMAESLRALPRPDRLARLHLGQLSPAEADKLVWRLPYVYDLDPDDRERAYDSVGRHPRALEYLNALLRVGDGDAAPGSGGRAGSGRFRGIADRLDKVLDARGVSRPARTAPVIGRADGGGGRSAVRPTVKAAVAEAVAVSAAEVLLDGLYRHLDAEPVTRRLLAAASVFRVPVDTDGLNWTLTEPAPPDPDRAARLRAVYERLRDAGVGATLNTIPFAPGEWEQFNRDRYGASYPQRHPDLDAACRRLLDLSLLSPARTADEGEWFVVHRWTAESLRPLARAEVRRAHGRAAEYHRWRAGLYHTETDLREAFFHFGAVGDIDARAAVGAELCTRLHARGAYDDERAICDEMLAALPDGSPHVALFLHLKAVIAVQRADYAEAGELQRRCLALAESAGDLVTAATSWQQLGVVAHLSGDPGAAERCYREAMGLCDRADLDVSVLARAVFAACYQQLGGLALEHGDPDDAWRWSVGAYDIVAELGEESQLGRTDDDLARIALAFGDQALADEHALGSYELRATQPDVLRLAVTSSLQLGAVHVLNDRPEEADEYLHRAVGQARRLGDRQLLARCLQLSGDVLFELGKFGAARSAYESQLMLVRDLDDQAGEVVVLQQLGRVAAAEGEAGTAETLLGTALQLAERTRNARLVAATHLYRGSTLPDGSRDEAVQRLTAGREAAQTAGDDTLWVSCVLHLAGLAGADDRVAEAIDLTNQALRRAAETRNDSAAVASCLTRGLLERYRGADKDAAGWLHEASVRAAGIGHRRLYAQCDLHLARIAADHGDLDGAIASYRGCLSIASLDRHADLVFHARRELGRCLGEQGDHAAAVPLLRQALEQAGGTPGAELWCLMRLMWSQSRADGDVDEDLAERCAAAAAALPPSPFGAAGLLCAGDAARVGGDETTARERYEQARAVARQWGRAGAGQLVDSMWQLGRLAHTAGDATAARECYLSAGVIAEDIGDRVAVAHILRELGRTMRDLDETDEARDAIRDSWHAALSLNDGRLAAVSELLLADLDAAAGRTDDAAERRARVAERFRLRGVVGRAESSPLYRAQLTAWDERLWNLRLRVAEGETPFVRPMAEYLGPSIDDIVRDMTPLASLISGIPAAVAPWVRRGGTSGQA